MPGHDTWFNFILPNYQELLRRFQDTVGKSWINGEDVSMKYVLMFALVSLIVLVLALIARGRITDTEKAIIPDSRFSLRTFFEAMIEGALSTMESVMDRKTAIYFLPVIGTCVFVIFFSNLIGLVPGFAPPTSNLSTTLAMALVIFSTTHIYGVKEHGFIKYFAHWCGPIRVWYALPLMVLMFCIEVVSHLARPASLSVRLMGNMFADHMVVGAFVSLIPLFVPVPIMLLGTVVCLVQTAVFSILSVVYIGMAVAHEEH
jgi:F-type H+-transporting ATPase subunit a